MPLSLTDFDQTCEIVTGRPDRRTGPLRLRAAVRSIILHRPLAETVEIELGDGTRLEEVAIEALYQIASGTIHLQGRTALRTALGWNSGHGAGMTETAAEPPRSARQ